MNKGSFSLREKVGMRGINRLYPAVDFPLTQPSLWRGLCTA
jgi:hypothetical protein